MPVQAALGKKAVKFTLRTNILTGGLCTNVHVDMNISSELFTRISCLQVHRSKLEEGEERFLRARLRQLESRRSSVERAGLVHLGVSGEGGVGGVVEALRTLEGHVDAILTQEEAHTQLSTTGQQPCGDS